MSTPSDLAREAMDLAVSADNKINAHEDLCAERYKNINDSLARIMKFIGWGGTAMAGLILSLLAWSLSAQVEANSAAIQSMGSANSAEAAETVSIQYVPVPVGPDGKPAIVLAPK